MIIESAMTGRVECGLFPESSRLLKGNNNLHSKYIHEQSSETAVGSSRYAGYSVSSAASRDAERKWYREFFVFRRIRLFFQEMICMNTSELHFASRFDTVSGSAIREIFKVIAQPGMISFAGGNPSLDALEEDTVSFLAAEALSQNGKAILQYGATEGYPPFLDSLKEYIHSALAFRFDDVLPVTGSTQAMDLLCKALINKGDRILVENPSFLGNLQCMKLYEAELIPVNSDESGMIPEHLEEQIRRYHPKMIYTIPTFQNPTGKTLPAERRKKIASLASEYGVVVAEDDPYRELRYTGDPILPIKCFDQDGWVVYLGSFSKTISPGLRVGFIAGNREIIRKCTIGKQSTDVHTANLNQAIVDLYIRKNLLDDHIRRICGLYGQKMNIMLDHLKQFPADIRFTQPQGGLFIWMELPAGMNALNLLPKAVEQKVAFVPGTHFCVDGGHENTIRLNFSNSTDEQISRGVEILEHLIQQERRS